MHISSNFNTQKSACWLILAPIIFVYRNQTESNVPGVNKSSACYHNVTATRTKEDMSFDVIIFGWVPRSWGKLWTGWILETGLPCFHTAKKLYISLILFYFWSYYSIEDNTLEKRLFCCLFSVIIISVFLSGESSMAVMCYLPCQTYWRVPHPKKIHQLPPLHWKDCTICVKQR